MRKTLYFVVLAICIISLYLLRDYACIRCIERDDQICLTTSSKAISEFIYKYTSCPECKKEMNIE